MNDKQVGFFSCSNGVRQGDPLSPILFFLVEEVLSRGIINLVANKQISLIKGSRHIMVPSHTLYPYDIMIFFLKVIKNLLMLFLICYQDMHLALVILAIPPNLSSMMVQ